MSGALLALRATLVEAHGDSVYTAYLAVKQADARMLEPGTRAVLQAIAAVLDSAYSEKEQAA